MKIYTRKGDKGFTSLIGGRKVPKNHSRIEAYGTIDELIAHIGLLHDMIQSKKYRKILIRIENRLMVCAAILASECGDCEQKVPDLNESDVNLLEKEIDRIEEYLPSLGSFVLPGGHPASSQCHVARTVCRRAERQITSISKKNNIPDVLLKYVNRLSDYLFVLSRKVLHDTGKKEIFWDPDL